MLLSLFLRLQTLLFHLLSSSAPRLQIGPVLVFAESLVLVMLSSEFYQLACLCYVVFPELLKTCEALNRWLNWWGACYVSMRTWVWILVPIKSWVQQCTYITPELWVVGRDRQIIGAHWPTGRQLASLAKLMSFKFNERPFLKKWGSKWPSTTVTMELWLPCVPTPAYTYINMYIQHTHLNTVKVIFNFLFFFFEI